MFTPQVSESSGSPREVYQTSDFYLACFMHARGYKLVDTIRSPRNGRVTIIFENHLAVAFKEDMTADQLVIAYYNGEATVSAFKFVAAIRELRGLLHSGQVDE